LIRAIDIMPVKPILAIVLFDSGEGASELLAVKGITLKSILSVGD
jgi:hypothetical protein